ncbi:MAG: hypothetical protein CL906_00185 [Dehalococcoidia bacterium]|nr:hypothetical protein [Dehalococcoidia bacterium]
MNKTSICDSKFINLESTLDGGQAFRWHRNGDHYRGVIGNKVYIISNENNLIYLNSLNFRMNEKDLKKIKKYLGLDFNLEEFKNIYKNDYYIYKLINQNFGLRILKQDPWETIVSFITSSVSNILKIKKNINDLCIFNGKKIGDGKFDYVFPTDRELIEIGEKNLRKLGFGFRSPYLIDAANKSINKEISTVKNNDSYDNKLNELIKIKGVGKKVADCIMTYGFERRDVFPVDRWVRRGLINNLGYNNKLSNDKLSVLAQKKYKNDSAYIQQYIFYGEKTS